MRKHHNKTPPDRPHPKPSGLHGREIMGELLALSGRDVLNRILQLDNPRQFVQSMSRVDFVWLVKKIGEDDALPLLRLGSDEQWGFLLDIELWQRDRLRLDQTSIWFSRLQKADPERLTRWLYRDGQLLAYYYLFRNIQVQIVKGDEVYELPDGFFTFDDVYYIRILDKEHEGVIENMLRQMAQDDYDQYQALLLGLAGLPPAEVEEELYRVRNVRMAEEGFLPHDEAISVYSYLNADSLKGNESLHRPAAPLEEHTRELVPVSPLISGQGNTLLAESAARITDPLFLDRIRLEFAGLCNQILSAEGLMVDDVDVLIKVSRKAAGYVNVGLERLSGGRVGVSEEFLRNNPVVSIFRAGFGLALELKWEAERWTGEAWFERQDLRPDFWGDEWGKTLVGILRKRPLYFKRSEKDEEYRDFERLSEIQVCRSTLHRMIALDRLLEILADKYTLDKQSIEGPFLTFQPLLFNFWARRQLKLDPGFATLSLEEVRDFFRLVRAKSPKPPFRMPGFRDIFIHDMMSFASDFEPEASGLLEETLSMLWRSFTEEYAWVATADIDGRFTKFLLIRPSY